MITETGFSKDPSIMPEGIAVTLGSGMIAEQGGLRTFLKGFLQVMSLHEEGYTWMHKLKNAPKFEIDHVYIIVHGRLYGRCYYGGHHKDLLYTKAQTADGKPITIQWPYIILSGPFERCPFRRELKGFQGFRYTTKLF